MKELSSITLIECIERTIYMIRGKRVMLDRDLAELYGVTTGRLNEQVRRNIERFPIDFMFQLSKEEFGNLISQIATSKGRGGLRKLPYTFTEQGVAMLSGVLRSPRAVAVNIEIMRAFVRFRHILSSQKELTKIVAELRSFVLKKSVKTDQEVQKIWQAIEKLSNPDAKRGIGFRLE